MRDRERGGGRRVALEGDVVEARDSAVRRREQDVVQRELPDIEPSDGERVTVARERRSTRRRSAQRASYGDGSGKAHASAGLRRDLDIVEVRLSDRGPWVLEV